MGPTVLKSAINRALATPDLHGGKDRGACGRSLRLWDATALALQALSFESGRRMLIILSSGEDHKSQLSWKALRNFADDYSIAIFGLRDLERFSGEFSLQRS